jgi:hypothetical protein
VILRESDAVDVRGSSTCDSSVEKSYGIGLMLCAKDLFAFRHLITHFGFWSVEKNIDYAPMVPVINGIPKSKWFSHTSLSTKIHILTVANIHR